jgi:hypothetical protein
MRAPIDLSLTVACAVVLLGNLADGLFTLTFLQLQLARELNPVMRWLYEGSPLAFMVGKLSMVQLGAVLLAHHRALPLAQNLMRAAAAVYSLIVGYHLSLVCLLA